MIGRSEKTLRNWASEGKLQFVNLFGVQLISCRMIENLLTHARGTQDGELARRLMGMGRRPKAE